MPQAVHCRKSPVRLYKVKHKLKITKPIRAFIPIDFNDSFSLRREIGVNPMNSLNVS